MSASAVPAYQENAGGAHSATQPRTAEDTHTTGEYVRFLTHQGTLTPPAQLSQSIPTASALVQRIHIPLLATYALLKSSLLLLVHPCPLLPSLPPALRRPVARMDNKTLCSPQPVPNKPNSSSSDRGNSSSTRKPGRSGSHSPGCSSLGGPAGAVLGNSMNLQQPRKRQLEGVLSKYTNLIQGWQNR